MMSTALLINIPLMVLAFALMVGIPLWMVLRRTDWHGKPEARYVPAYLAHRTVPVRASTMRLPRTVGYEGRRAIRPLSGGANG